MRKTLLGLLASLLVAAAGHAQAFQSAPNDCGRATSCQVILAKPARPGDSIAVVVRVGDLAQTPKVTDSTGTSYLVVGSQKQTADGHTLWIVCGANITGGSNPAVTAAVASATTLRIVATEFAGSCSQETPPMGNQGSGAASSTPAFTAFAGDFVLAAVSTAENKTFTPLGSFTLNGTTSKMASGGLASPGGSLPATSFTFSAADQWAALTVAFKPPGTLLRGKVTFDDGSTCAACRLSIFKLGTPDILLGPFTTDTAGAVSATILVDTAASYRAVLVDATNNPVVNIVVPNLGPAVIASALPILAASEVDFIIARLDGSVKVSLLKLP